MTPLLEKVDKKTRLRADEIKHALSKVYGGITALFLTEVKTGPTWYAGEDSLMKIDALSLKLSWAKPCITAFEIKVSRSDFMNDDKWPGYLDYCHRFYFVCPSGLISRDEVSPEVGLIYVNDAGNLLTRKKSLFRNIDLPWTLFYHLVISHMKQPKHPFFNDEREYMEALAADKPIKRQLELAVSEKKRSRIPELEKENQQLLDELEFSKEAVQENKDIRKALNDFGVHGYQISARLKELRKRLAQKVTDADLRTLRDMKDTLNKMELLND